ncbi:hypothetical protein Pint_00381 [Pistacia integerrima]|uniref:Uncharacterized protein n=1 Tax=Pistacia integerrima TaxID=434235 RepID=A0ACC0ZL46_9ROSI|nr:hypothetical protein Pint_00381 [Pistacia integerrima]
MLARNVPGESVKGVLLDVNRLTEERLDELLNKFLKDFKEGWLDKEGFVMTDMNCNVGLLTVAEGAESCVRVALLPHGGPSALYFSRNQVTTF